MTTACPSREELALIGTIAGGGSCPPGIATHIEDCSECRDVPGAVRRRRPGVAARPVGRASGAVHGSADRRLHDRARAGPRCDGRRVPGPPRYAPAARCPQAACRVGSWPARASGGNGCVKPRPRRRCGIPTSSRCTKSAEVDDWFLLVLEYIPGRDAGGSPCRAPGRRETPQR